jgi:2-phosphosulfolactate phosphatase
VRVDVYFGAQSVAPAEAANRVVVVIDVLRASTTIAVALANGARTVIPLESSDAVVTRAKAFERAHVRMAGERKMLPIPGFDFGNSPREFTRGAIEGKTVLMTTSNGTHAIAASQGARDVIIGSYVNFSAVATVLRTALRGNTDIAIVCAGREHQFALEDAGCAGRYVYHVTKRMSNVDTNDAAQACVLLDRKYADNVLRLFDASEHGRALRAAGFADDLDACAEIDSYPIIPVYQDRQITKLGPDRER